MLMRACHQCDKTRVAEGFSSRTGAAIVCQAFLSSPSPPRSRDPASAKAPSFIHRVVTIAKLKAREEMQQKAYLMFIYDGATCVFRSIIHYRDDSSWASVRWSVNSKGGGSKGVRR